MSRIEIAEYNLDFNSRVSKIIESKENQDEINIMISDFFTDILIYTSVIGEELLKEEVTYYLNKLMDDFGLEKLSFENNILLYEILRAYDRFPLLKPYNVNEIKNQIGVIDNIVLESYQIDDKYLNRKQKSFYNSILKEESIVFSAPTSYGKTTIMFQGISKLFKQGKIKNVLFIVPTKSLINEYWKMFREVDLTENVVISDSPYDDTDWYKNNILLYTQERTLIKYSREDFSDKIDYVIVDEAQSIARIVKKRNLLLLKALRLFDESKKIFLAPFVENFGTNVLENFNLIKEDTKEIFVSKEDSLVTNDKYVIDLVCADDKVTVSKLNGDIIAQIDKNIISENYDYDEAALCVYDLIDNGIFKEGNILFFVASKPATIQMAIEVMYKSKEKNELTSRTKALINHLITNIHEDFSLIEMIKKGVAYHNAYLDDYTKRQLEYIITETDDIDILCSTSTISKGVNITARNIVAFIKQTLSSDLPEVEFKNTLGRSARLHMTNQGNLYYVVMKKKKQNKYLDEFSDNSAYDLKIRDIDVKNRNNRVFIEANYDKVDMQNLLRDKSFKGSKAINDVKEFLVNKEICNDEDLSEIGIANMDFLLGILEIDEINNKILGLGKEETLHMIDCWDSVDDLEILITTLSYVYDWDNNLSLEKKIRMMNHRFLAVILHKIVHNMSIKSIVDSNLKSVREGRQKLYVKLSSHMISNKQWALNNGYVMFDPNNKTHVNSMIINTLDQVQHLIEFDLKRFLQDFYYRVLKIYNINHDQVSENTERFLEYTTISPTKVKLMKSGISDSFALNFLLSKPKYVEFVDSKVFSLRGLKDMVLHQEGEESPIYYAIADRI